MCARVRGFSGVFGEVLCKIQIFGRSTCQTIVVVGLITHITYMYMKGNGANVVPRPYHPLSCVSAADMDFDSLPVKFTLNALSALVSHAVISTS